MRVLFRARYAPGDALLMKLAPCTGTCSQGLAGKSNSGPFRASFARGRFEQIWLPLRPFLCWVSMGLKRILGTLWPLRELPLVSWACLGAILDIFTVWFSFCI